MTQKTVKIPVSNAAWTDLGVGPLLVELDRLTVSMLISISATTPDINDPGHLLIGKDQVSRSRKFDHTTNLWAKVTDATPNVYVIVTPYA